MERFGLSVGGQLLEAVRFAGIGILLAVVYDLFRLCRLFGTPSPRRVFFEDVLFFALAAALTLLLSLPVSHGVVRVFHLLALTLGFFSYYHTVGRLIYAAARRPARALRRLRNRRRVQSPPHKKRKKISKTA